LKVAATRVKIISAADQTACTKHIKILGGREMPVSILSRWTAKQEDVLRIGRRVKSFYERHGAEMRVGQIFTGPNAGQFLAAARFPDWETCGKAMQAMSADAEYQSLMAEAHQVAELHGRSIVVSLDL
jgi:hypothetical protein